MAKRLRLDLLLVERGLFTSRAKAQAAVMAGLVRLRGEPALKPGTPVPEDAPVELAGERNPFVSRGGLKLRAALEAFGTDPEGRTCLDVGASTGGFTDCLLQGGAAKVYAVDVGTAQLDARLKADPRVVRRENTHARDLSPDWFSPLPSLAVMDVSFISALALLPAVRRCLASGAELLLLVKPQFEVGPKLAPKGVVRDPAARAAAVAKVRAGAEALGLRALGQLECPVKGPKGNIETFLRLAAPAAGPIASGRMGP